PRARRAAPATLSPRGASSGENPTAPASHSRRTSSELGMDAHSSSPKRSTSRRWIRLSRSTRTVSASKFIGVEGGAEARASGSGRDGMVRLQGMVMFERKVAYGESQAPLSFLSGPARLGMNRARDLLEG